MVFSPKGRRRTQYTTWAPPGHFYSPIVDPNDPIVQQIVSQFHSLELPECSGIDLNREKMIAMLERLARHYARLPFDAVKRPNLNFYYENPAFSYGDAIILGLIMIEFRPSKILEVGSGFSSCALIDINEIEFEGNISINFVDPNPGTLFNLLPVDSRYREQLRGEPIQAVPLRIFRELRANDILFIDSSHISKMGSDVNHLIFNIFPLLNPGVLIHVHDIPYPFEYSPEWVIKENRSWNEAYLLRAFLQFNDAFEIVFYNHYATRKFPDRIQELIPLFLKNGGASIWLRRKS